MLFLLALPVFLSVAATHRYLSLYAPSNILIQWVRTSQPRWWTAGALAWLTSLLVIVVRALEAAITAGAPRLLNLVALVLVWDAIKVGATAMHTVILAVVRSVHHRLKRTEAGLLARPPVKELCGDGRPLLVRR